MFYIHSAATISHQPSFQNEGFSGELQPLSAASELINPNYKDYIDPGLLRRMSKVLRMSVACGKEALKLADISQPDAIVVGTGLGCLQDTEKFLTNVLTLEGMLPPTSFIQSTHNTIAGQISLSIGNHGYNMTHTQNSVSFECALKDAELLILEGNQTVLVGAADEHIPFLDEVVEELGVFSQEFLTSGASFFVASANKEKAVAQVVAVETIVLFEDIVKEILDFLEANLLAISQLDKVLFSGIDLAIFGNVLSSLDLDGSEEGKLINFLFFSGLYPTASAFAMNWATDHISQSKDPAKILICNWIGRTNLGLILIQSVEA